MLNNGVLIEKNIMAEKQCSVCKQVLPITEFRRYKNRSGTFGYRGSCKACEKEQNRKRDQKKKAQLGIDNTLVERQCSVCGQVLPITKFRKYKNQNGSIGYRGSCRQCEKARERKRYWREKAQLGVDTEEKEDNYRFLNFYKKVKGS